MSEANNTSLFLLQNSTGIYFPAQSRDFIIALHVTIGVICLLSILGSGSIILSFLLFKELRTASRFLLFNLSIADLIVAVINSIGAATSYKFVGVNETKAGDMADRLCVFQASVGLYGTDCSILWTVVFMMYLYISVACYRPSLKINRILIILLMIVCWGLPMVIVVVFTIKQYFGFEPGYSPGFCSIVNDDQSQFFRIVIGYEMFLYSSFLVLPGLSVAFICHIYCKQRSSSSYYTVHGQQYLVVKNAETKLIFVPIVFILIRVWGFINDITTFYLSYEDSIEFRQKYISAVFVFLAGTGDSAQGFVNGIFFCLLTPAVRNRLILTFIKCITCLCCRCCRENNSVVSGLLEVSTTISRSISQNSYISQTDTDSLIPRSRKSTSLTDVSSYGSGSDGIDEIY